MGLTSELYLSKKIVAEEDWKKLIDVVSNYNGLFKAWKIYIVNQKNIIRYFIESNCNLPTTINNLNTFLLKPIKGIKLKKEDYSLLSFPKLDSNIIDLINLEEIKNNASLKYIEISFIKISKNNNKYLISYYVKRKRKFIKKILLFLNPTTLLKTNFEKNKTYFYKSSPKYLDINKILHLLNTDSNNALLSIDTFPYLEGKFYLNQASYCFDKHSIIMGSSGCGKSKFICSMINNIKKNKNINQKYKVVVIDPHASLENDIGGIGKVIDFKTKMDSINLFMNDSDDIISNTELLLELIKSLIEDQYNSKLERVLRHSIYLLLTNSSFNFENLRKVILDLEYRNNLIKEEKNNLPTSVIDFFLSDFNELKTKSYSEAISPVISFIDEMEMVPTFNNEQNKIDLKETINNNFLTLFSLDRTKLGDKVIKTISGLIMQQLLNIIGKNELKEHIIFIIDEVSILQNPILERYLSESRKYNLSLILAGQYFNQLKEELKNSIFANVSNYYIFRVSKLDANVLVDNFNMKIPLDDSRDRKIKLLTELQARECVVRIDSNGVLLPAFKGITLDYKSIPKIKKNITDNNILNNKNSLTESKVNFVVNSNISLKDILISSSTSKKGV